jgi:hypothetical protein
VPTSGQHAACGNAAAGKPRPPDNTGPSPARHAISSGRPGRPHHRLTRAPHGPAGKAPHRPPRPEPAAELAPTGTSRQAFAKPVRKHSAARRNKLNTITVQENNHRHPSSTGLSRRPGRHKRIPP